MNPGQANATRLDLVLLLLALALFLFASPFTDWWAGAGLPWYTPFVLWALLIAAMGLRHWYERDHGA